MKRDPKQIADEWLVMRSQEGSAAALDVLLRKWHRPLWLRACRLTGDEETANDVTQEILLAIARGIRRLNDPARFRAWAFQIASNKSRDWVRRRGRERRNLETVEDADSEPSSDWLSEATRDDRIQSVRDGLKRLPLEQREILHLHYQLGFTLNEIREAESIPVGTVKSRLHAAREQLRKQLSTEPSMET